MTFFILIGYVLLTLAQPFDSTVMQLTIDPPVVERGRTVRLLCYVPPHPDNEYAVVGVAGYHASMRPLRGELSNPWQELAITARCGYGLGFCETLNRKGARRAFLSQAFRIWPCPDGDGR